MGNCNKSQEEPAEINKKARAQSPLTILTFSGPNAYCFAPSESPQPTFSDPVFFASMSSGLSRSEHSIISFNHI
jgi:hypothetical protein